jgi:hypothetical protein
MSSKDAQEMNLAIQKSTIEAANVYCRVLELHIKAVAEGSDPRLQGKMGDSVKLAATELGRELGLLRSLRNGLIDEAIEKDSRDEK